MIPDRTVPGSTWRSPTLVADDVRDLANLIEEGERLQMTSEVDAIIAAWERWHMTDVALRRSEDAIIDAVNREEA